MRASTSLTSFFSSLRSSTIPSHMLIPIIRIISPSDRAPPRLSPGRAGIRRWRGARGTLGDLTLQLPSQGITSGARLALARQGCATGSFRLNCAESLYVKDERGLAMFQRIELEDELEKARLGLRERPPMLAASALDDTGELSTTASIDAGSPSEVAGQLNRKTRRPSLRTQKRHMLAMQNIRFDSGGLSSCVTFTEGLCHLEDYVRASDADSVTSVLPTIHSEQEISQLVVEGDSPKLSWLESLRRKTFATANKAIAVKKRRSTSEFVRSVSCMGFDMSFSDADLTLHVDTSSSSSPADSGHMTEETIHRPADDHDLDVVPTGILRREGSWTRLRRRFSRTLSIRSLSTKSLDLSVDEKVLVGSVSVTPGLFRAIQQGIPANLIHPSIRDLS